MKKLYRVEASLRFIALLLSSSVPALCSTEEQSNNNNLLSFVQSAELPSVRRTSFGAQSLLRCAELPPAFGRGTYERKEGE